MLSGRKPARAKGGHPFIAELGGRPVGAGGFAIYDDVNREQISALEGIQREWEALPPDQRAAVPQEAVPVTVVTVRPDRRPVYVITTTERPTNRPQRGEAASASTLLPVASADEADAWVREQAQRAGSGRAMVAVPLFLAAATR